MNNNLQNKILSFLLLMMTASLSFGQTLPVTGVVEDSENGEPLIGATILVRGTGSGTVTDFDGTFEVQANPATDTLEISYTGYEDLLFPLDGLAQVNIKLGIASNQLDEVIVVGYGTQKKREVTGSTARVSAEEIKATPILRVEQALQGRTAGVQVTNLSGQPGEEPTVRIRGIGTTGNSKPLYIVDGMPVAGIDYLNPGDIESLDVLKDASTAGIYGTRGANGVVLITTKKGAQGKMNVTYETYYGIQNPVNTLDMLNADQYRLLMNEGARNAGQPERFDLNEIPPHNTDWQDAIFVDNAPMLNHQLSFNGGNKKSNFASSLSYFSQEGIIGGERSKFDRYTGRLNSTHEVTPWLRMGNNLAYTHLKRRGIGSNTSFNGVYSSALNMDPLTPVFETDPVTLSQTPFSTEPVVTDREGNIYGISQNVDGEVVNPLALLETTTGETRKDQIVGNIYVELEPIKGLKLRSSGGIDFAYLLDDGYRPLFYLNGAQLNIDETSVSKNIQRFYTWQIENTISYEKEFGQHKVTGLVGTTALEFDYENLFGFNTDVPTFDPDNVYLNLATDTMWMANGGYDDDALLSYFGRVNYSFNNKYTVSALIRRDGSSKFGANNRYATFGSIGATWVLSEEPFIQNIAWIDALQLRGSWGTNGNESIPGGQSEAPVEQFGGYTFGSGRSIGAYPAYLPNEDIAWEESEQFNIGFDLGLFNNKLQVVSDFYSKSTNGLLERIPIPGHVGNIGAFANVGSVRNRGVELAVSWREKVGKVRYEIGLNGAYNQNEMTFIGNAEKVLVGASWAIAGPVTRSEEGFPIAYFWGYETNGIFQNENEVFQHINQQGEVLQPSAVPGDVRFVDKNQDGVIDDADRTFLGNPNPDFTLGFNASIDYANFDFSMFFQGQIGNEVFNGTQRQDLEFTNRTTDALDRWTGEGTSNSTPRFVFAVSDNNNNYRISDLYIEDGSFVRLRNIQLGYTFPKGFLDKIKAEQWRIYVSAENVFTLTNYTGVDPEIGAASSFDVGIDRGVYPPARTIRVGTALTF